MFRSTFAALAGAFVLSSMAATPALAKTAEETVMYILNGYEGISATNMYINMRPVEGSKNKLSIFWQLNQWVEIFSLEYTKIDDCNYNVKVSMPANIKAMSRDMVDANVVPKANVIVDFSKAASISGFDFDTKAPIITGINYQCQAIGDEKNCEEVMYRNVANFPVFNVGDQDRIKAAFAYFKDKYCAGSPF